MKKILLAIMVIGTIALTGCIGPSHPEGEYISESSSQCSEILYTCPQFQKPFSDNSGCGCEPQGEGEEDNPGERSLNNLLAAYLKTMVIEPQHGGIIEADYIMLNATEEYLEETVELHYEIWAEIHEYYDAGEEGVGEGVQMSGPIALEITQPGKSYIINSFESYDEDNEQEIRENLTEEGAEWVLKSEKESVTKLKNRVKSAGEGLIQLKKALEEEK